VQFAEKLRALRKQHDLKQTGLADRAGLTANKVQRYEQSNQKPKGDDILALARALGVTADYLLDDDLPYPPPEECLSEKTAVIQKLEGLIAALTSRDAGGAVPPGELPEVVHLPIFKLGAGFDVVFDAVGTPSGDPAGRDMYFNGLGEGCFFAAELHGSSMRGPGRTGFSLGEVLVFKKIEPDELASGDFVYVRTEHHGLFRQVFLHGGRLRLRALNPADPEIRLDASEVQHVCRLVRRIKEY
jgi:transcriptional regulator with XRE-family HTH domain